MSVTTVLYCHGFVQNRLAFEVPGRSFPRALEDAGFRAQAIEMRGRDGGPPAAGFSVYIGDAARFVEAAAASGPVAWVGHSMGGLIGLCLPDRARAQLRALVTIGAPLIPGPQRLNPPVLGPALGHGLVAWSRLMHARGRAFPGKPYGRGFSRARRVSHTQAPLPVRLWRTGSLDDAALDATLHTSFSRDSFAVLADLLGLLHSGGRRAGDVDVDERVRSLTTPLLVVTGAHDDLAPTATARILHARAERSAERLHLDVDAGHIDLLIGADAPRSVWQPTIAFLRRHTADRTR